MDQLFDIKALSKMLDIKEPTLRAWVFQKKIPYIRMSRLIRFKKSEIERWLREFEKK